VRFLEDRARERARACASMKIARVNALVLALALPRRSRA
jgi:hypothetical protein